MIDDIRNWFGDIASGKIKDAHLAMSEATARDFERKLSEAISENGVLRSQLDEATVENSTLKTRIVELERQLEELSDDRDPSDEPNRELLKLLFDAPEGLSISEITNRMRMTTSEAKFHLGVLLELGFIDTHQGSVGFYSTDGFGESHYSGGTPEIFWIEQPGRSHIMKTKG